MRDYLAKFKAPADKGGVYRVGDKFVILFTTSHILTNGREMKYDRCH